MTELKRCPFCGGEAETLTSLNGYVTCCISCDCIEIHGATVLLSIERWNTRADGWQPIETAPKDGTTILVSCADDGFGKVVCAAIWFYGEYDADTGWYLYEIAGDCLMGPIPTHWMPLPSPPKDS